MITKEELISFENWVVDTFNDGQLKSPVHLSGGNETELIEIFKQIKPTDWVFSTYRSHYHALLHGISEQWLKEWILDNKSIHVMNKEHKFITSAIVGGTLPIALGVAMAIQRNYPDEYIERETLLVKNHLNSAISPHVWCFVGDMTAESGEFIHCWKYALHYDLPITFIIEDNGLSTDTKTQEVWGKKNSEWLWASSYFPKENDKIIYYQYKRVWPHYGTSRFISSLWAGIKDDVRSKGF